MRVWLHVVLGFILFNAQIGKDAIFTLRMDEQTGETWTLTVDLGVVKWQPIAEDEEHAPPKRAKLPKAPSDFGKPKW